jgi:mannosyltransferase
VRLAALVTRRIEIPILAVLAALIVVIGSDTPSIWYDEAATIVSATRTWPELWAMLHTVDAVHGVYYAIMHVWFDVVGYSPFTLRLPSAIVSGGTVALTMVLASRFGTRGFALLAGVVLITIPRFTWAGIEGRSYATTALLAVALTLLLMRALRAPAPAPASEGSSSRWQRVWPWLAYAVVALFSVGIFVYLALVVVAHAVTVVVLTSSGTLGRRQLFAFGRTVVPLGLVCIPFVLIVAAQSGQVGWIDPISQRTLNGILVTQFAPKNPPFAIFTWLVVLIGITTFIVARHSATIRARAARDLMAWVLPWLVAPTVVLVLTSVLVTPLYSPRYLTFLMPALAIAIAGGIVGLGRLTRLAARLPVFDRWPRMRSVPYTALASIAGVLVLALLTQPSYVAQRGSEAKQDASWSKAAWRVSQISSSLPADASTAVVFGSIAYHPGATARVVDYAYPWAFTSLDDVALDKPIGASDRLWETANPVDTQMLDGHDSVILVSSGRDREANQAAIEKAGFTETGHWHYTNLGVRLYERPEH